MVVSDALDVIVGIGRCGSVNVEVAECEVSSFFSVDVVARASICIIQTVSYVKLLFQAKFWKNTSFTFWVLFLLML